MAFKLSSMTFSSIAALFGSMIVLAIIPSPSVFAVVARSIASGFTHGFVTVIGIVVGDFIFITLAITGKDMFGLRRCGMRPIKKD